FGLSRAGGATSLRVVAADGGRLEPLEIDRVPHDAQVAWHGDARAFYYPRVVEATAGQDAPETRIYRHVLGRPTDRDEIVFGPGVGGALGVAAGAQASLHVPADSRAAFAVVPAAGLNTISVYATEQKELAAGRPRWRR